MVLQNPSGVMVGKEIQDDRLALNQLKEWQVDIIALPETNKNWNQPATTEKWKWLVQGIWKHTKVYRAAIKYAPQEDH